MNDAARANLAADLEAFSAGRLTEAELRFRHEGQRTSRLFDVVWSNIEHYIADADIRQRDSAYRVMQESELKRLMRLLREGSTDEELQQVTFLSRHEPND
ncbi:MAG TPA: hypothetical protein VEV20_01840 [Burkholderiales bacterium]|nr:hypothetical protein [Burkholderiales bacterium]